eukprot:s11005_g1.t1
MATQPPAGPSFLLTSRGGELSMGETGLMLVTKFGLLRHPHGPGRSASGSLPAAAAGDGHAAVAAHVHLFLGGSRREAEPRQLRGSPLPLAASLHAAACRKAAARQHWAK